MTAFEIVSMNSPNVVLGFTCIRASPATHSWLSVVADSLCAKHMTAFEWRSNHRVPPASCACISSAIHASLSEADAR
jgi:hypothetical protein